LAPLAFTSSAEALQPRAPFIFRILSCVNGFDASLQALPDSLHLLFG
jgi:hypothetical protein